MDIKQSSEKQGRPYHLSDSGTVIKRNFILIPAYILLQNRHHHNGCIIFH